MPVSRRYLVCASAGALLGILALGRPAAAVPKPVGPAFVISECPGCRQHQALVAGNSLGAQVSWARFNGRGSDVVSRIVRADGAQGPELVIHLGDSFLAAPSAASDGAFWTAWAAVDAIPNQFFVRRYRLDGQWDFEFWQNAPGPLGHYEPTGIAGKPGFDALVVFDDLPNTFALTPVRSWRVAAGPIEFPHHVADTFGRSTARICPRPLGAVSAWTDRDANGSSGLRWVALDPDGLPIAAASQLVERGGLASNPAFIDPSFDLACAPDGGFVVAWQTALTPPAKSGIDVVVRRFDKKAKPVGNVTLASKSTGGDQVAPAVAFEPSGGFVVAWRFENAAGPGLALRRFSKQGAPAGGNVIVAGTQGAGRVGAPDLAAIGSKGRVLLVWAQDETIRGQIFRP